MPVNIYYNLSRNRDFSRWDFNKIAGMAYFRLLIIHVLCVTLLLSCRDNANEKKFPSVPSLMLIGSTKHVDCQLDPDYPFSCDRRIEAISGVVSEIWGSRMYPWRVAAIDSTYLFDPATGDPLCDPFIGKSITAKGYPGIGTIEMRDPFDKGSGTRTITFRNAFFVCEMIDWYKIRANSMGGHSVPVTSENSYFWLERNRQKPYNYINPDYPFKTEKATSSITGCISTSEAVPIENGYIHERMTKSVRVNERYLFNINSNNPLSIYDFYHDPMDREITVIGYPGENIVVTYPNGKSVLFDKVFRISEILNWKYVTFYDPYHKGEANFWIENTDM